MTGIIMTFMTYLLFIGVMVASVVKAKFDVENGEITRQDFEYTLVIIMMIVIITSALFTGFICVNGV